MMLFDYPFVLAALALCLMLSTTLSVFGHHVVRRGVIFVDLALAQVAALGSSVGFALGWGADRPVANFALSLGFTLAGAALFAWFRRRRAPIEALIGITYAAAMAFSLILLERSATGAEELKEMLVGSILTVEMRQLVICAALCLATGLLLWTIRKPLFRITEDPGAAEAEGLRLPAWDFLFYAAFGVLVTFAVRATGVLLVFAFLVAPALASLLTAARTRARLAFGWGFAFVGCLLGLEASLRFDLSAGPVIVAVFVLLLALTGLITGLRSSRP
jgi:zinc/manganese transport system permease protein